MNPIATRPASPLADLNEGEMAELKALIARVQPAAPKLAANG